MSTYNPQPQEGHEKSTLSYACYNLYNFIIVQIINELLPRQKYNKNMDCWPNKVRLEGLLSQTRALTSMFKEAEKDETEVSGRALTHGRKTFTSKTW